MKMPELIRAFLAFAKVNNLYHGLKGHINE